MEIRNSIRCLIMVSSIALLFAIVDFIKMPKNPPIDPIRMAEQVEIDSVEAKRKELREWEPTYPEGMDPELKAELQEIWEYAGTGITPPSLMRTTEYTNSSARDRIRTSTIYHRGREYDLFQSEMSNRFQVVRVK